MVTRAEQKIYSDFFTNGAVAWFSAGGIVPLFTPIQKLDQLMASLGAIAMCGVFLQFAKQAAKRSTYGKKL